MQKNLKALIGAWFHDGFVTNEVDDFFRLFGKQLTTRSLAGVVKLTQAWMDGLRPQGVERWEMPKLEGIDMDRLASITSGLGMLEAVMPEGDAWDEPDKRHSDVLVILGAMTESMQYRLLFAINQCLGYKRLCMVTGVRALVDKEKKILVEAGIDADGKTEADAAHFLLDKYGCSGDVIAAANKPDGKRATTEETILELAKTLPDGGSLTLVSHMPFRFRQELTVLRALSAAGSRQRVRVLGAPKLKPLSELPATFFDEACRILFEIGKIPADLLAD